MHILWGSLVALGGLFLLLCARAKSDFFIYRLLVARSRILWGDKVPIFHQVAGAVMIVFGALVALGHF
jgi:hypothetical protein